MRSSEAPRCECPKPSRREKLHPTGLVRHHHSCPNRYGNRHHSHPSRNRHRAQRAAFERRTDDEPQPLGAAARPGAAPRARPGDAPRARPGDVLPVAVFRRRPPVAAAPRGAAVAAWLPLRRIARTRRGLSCPSIPIAVARASASVVVCAAPSRVCVAARQRPLHHSPRRRRSGFADTLPVGFRSISPMAHFRRRQIGVAQR
mmetsp:Transcript_19791/g.55897  ORF Transcript_19791/g.55897 Transcript_19791/m.55897 type:complete len:202 (+) Transcript_19791:1561-2166(+)